MWFCNGWCYSKWRRSGSDNFSQAEKISSLRLIYETVSRMNESIILDGKTSGIGTVFAWGIFQFWFRLLAKKCNSKVFFFFSYSDQNIVKFDVKVKKHEEMTNFLLSSVGRGLRQSVNSSTAGPPRVFQGLRMVWERLIPLVSSLAVACRASDVRMKILLCPPFSVTSKAVFWNTGPRFHSISAMQTAWPANQPRISRWSFVTLGTELFSTSVYSYSGVYIVAPFSISSIQRKMVTTDTVTYGWEIATKHFRNGIFFQSFDSFVLVTGLLLY